MWERGWKTFVGKGRGMAIRKMPQQIHIEYTVVNGRLTQCVLELLNAVMLRNVPEAQE